MKKLVNSLLFCLLTLIVGAQTGYQPSAANLASRQDFQDRKFGMFIHWGIYSLLGDGEWVMYQQKIPYEKYKRIANAFYPHDFNAREWVRVAKEAGMKYITITSRHHDGFSMFDTKASDYNIMKATPFKRDPLRELAEACREEGLKMNFYYSLLDWGRSDYAFGQPIVDGKPKGGDWDSYINFMKAQLTELLTQYGDMVSSIWFDGDWERKDVNWHYDEIYGLIHRLRPEVLIGNNHHDNLKPGEDYQLFEKDLPGGNSHGWGSGAVSDHVPLETCETINYSWGFNINDKSYKSVHNLIHYLVKAAGQNANFLLNVGPQPDGRIQQEFVDTLKKVGEWLSRYGESIYGTRGNPGGLEPWGAITHKGKESFVHLLEPVKETFILCPNFSGKVLAVKSLENGQSLKWKQQPEGLFIYLEGLPENAHDRVIRVETK